MWFTLGTLPTHYLLPVTLHINEWINTITQPLLVQPMPNQKVWISYMMPPSTQKTPITPPITKTSIPRGLKSTLPNRHDQSYKTWQGLPVEVQRVRRRDNTRHPLEEPVEPASLSTVAAPQHTDHHGGPATKPPSPSMCFHLFITRQEWCSLSAWRVLSCTPSEDKSCCHTEIIPSPNHTSCSQTISQHPENVKPYK